MKNLLSNDQSVEHVADMILNGSYPAIAKQLAAQLKECQSDRYAADWRKVCAALNTSPDSSVDVVLAKIATLQAAFHAKKH